MSYNAAAERLGYSGSLQDSTWEIFVSTWGDNRPMPAKEVFDIELLKMVEESRIANIKLKASEIITARYPAWKQANLQARYTELLEEMLSGGELTAEEQTEKDSIKAAWNWVKQIRNESNRLEQLPGASKDDGNWNL